MKNYEFEIPVMSCSQAKSLEKRFFNPTEDRGSESPPRERDFMLRAGNGIGDFILSRLSAPPAHLLALVGKGHNGGDALIAAKKVLTAFPQDSVPAKLIFFAESWDALAPLTMDAYEDFLRACGKVPVHFVKKDSRESLDAFLPAGRGGVIIDGIYGHGFRPPLRENIIRALTAVNEIAPGNLCVAVDLPSGLSDSPCPYYAFSADFTCATGILKTPLLLPVNEKYVGRIVPLSIGFPTESDSVCAVDTRFVLKNIPQTRPVFCDKRSFGHVLIVGGSRTMPGALMLNTLAALQSGAGLVSVLCPESVHAAFAARAPGAMWIPCKETAEGALAPDDTLKNFRARVAKASAILCGSGMSDSPDAQAICQAVAAETPQTIPLILDADALRPNTMAALRHRGENVLLPHAGEFLRIGGNLQDPKTLCGKLPLAAVALKGAYTEIISAEKRIYTFSGTSALARGGSGDVLAGIVASIFSERALRKDVPATDLLTQAVCWHGTAAQYWEQALGTRSARIDALPDYLGCIFRKPSTISSRA